MDSEVIVQFYEVHHDSTWFNYASNDPYLKIPICLGALISQKHVLTTKSCFVKGSSQGNIDERNNFVRLLSYELNLCLLIMKYEWGLIKLS